MDNSLSLLELAELLLVASYEETQTLGHMNFFISVTEIAANLGVEDLQQIIDASHLLEEKGCILLAFDHATALSASITPEGEMYIQNGGETGIIGEYRRYRASAHGKMDAGLEFEPAPTAPVIDGIPDYGPVGTEPPLNPRPDQNYNTHVVASIEILVKNNASLSVTEKDDLIIDVRMLELVLSKTFFQKSLADAISSNLKKLPGVGPLIELLFSMRS
ncbi:MAG: hypothetical protein ABFD12_00640 [Syntrophorhabdus sp.]